VFGRLRSDRDPAILAIAVSNGARASELLGVRGADLDWGDQLVRVVRKGSVAEQWLPASADAFVWIRLYLAGLGEPPRLSEPLWWTLRRRDRGKGLQRQPMTYEALRAVFRRVNVELGTNWSMLSRPRRHATTPAPPGSYCVGLGAPSGNTRRSCLRADQVKHFAQGLRMGSSRGLEPATRCGTDPGPVAAKGSARASV
jgi:hypothetical protein